MDGVRTPLSGREYGTLQTLFAIVSGFEAGLTHIKGRAETAGCWEDMQEVRQLASDSLDAILKTVPERKLQHIRQDLSNIRLHIKTEPPGLRTKDIGYSYTPTDTLNDLLNYMIQHECSLCDKTAQESRKCPFRKTIEDSLPHEVDGTDREHCKYSDLVLGLEVV